jgi:hypothetical protein
MEEGWILIYRSDEEYQAFVIKQLLEEHSLHPVLMDRKDDEFRLGQAEVYVAETEAEKAKEVIQNNMEPEME